ncbi:MAG: geranylgeranylglycerol-phosphate geranylgeranyltransferase [Haliscomenobacter sp.]
MAFAGLLRWPNLLIVYLTQYLFYQRLFLPAIHAGGRSPGMPFNDFFVPALTTISLTAGGYILNDILNLDADRINRPDRALPTGRVSLRSAQWSYFMLSVSGFISALYLAFSLNHLQLLILYPLALGLLAFYSAYLQRTPLWGNLLISLFCAGVPLLIWLAERAALQKMQAQDYHTYRILFLWTWWYALLAFLSNLFREVVKDMQDIRGDYHAGMRTFPIAFGLAASRNLALVIACCLLTILGIPFLLRLPSPPAFSLSLLLFSFLPFLVASWLLLQYQRPNRLKLASTLIKIGMAGGLLALYLL